MRKWQVHAIERHRWAHLLALVAATLLCMPRVAAAQGQATVVQQGFDTPGSDYTVVRHLEGNGPAVLTEGEITFLRLAQTAAADVGPETAGRALPDQLNAVLFAEPTAGRFGRIIADFDYRITAYSSRERSDGLSFVLLDQEAYELANGPPTYYSEEPSLPFSFGVGLDIYRNSGTVFEPGIWPEAMTFSDPNNNHVSVHVNGAIVQSVPLDTDVWDLVTGEVFHHVRLELVARDGQYELTLQLTAPSGESVTPVEALALPGLPDFSPRPCVAARVGRAGALHDLDNVVVQFLEPLQGDEGLPEAWQQVAAETIPVSLAGPAQVAAGDTLSVPLSLDMTASTHALGAFKATVSWPQDQLSLVEVLPGAFGELMVNTRFLVDGQVTFAGLNPAGMTGVAELAQLRFAVLGGSGSAGQVHASMAELVAAAASGFSDLTAGSVAGVWAYEIELLTGPGGLGDVDDDGEVTIRDALLIATYATGAGIAALPDGTRPEQADVDADGRVSMRDALIVATYVVDPQNANLPPALGVRQETLALGDLHSQDLVVLTVEPAPATRGYSLSMAWDPDALSLVDVRPTPAGSSTAPGRLQLAVMTILPDDPLIIELRARAQTRASTLRQTLHAVAADFSPGQVAVHSQVLSPTAVTAESGSRQTSWSLRDAYPNPFNASTVIRYTVVPGAQARLRIHDLQGQLVRELHLHGHAREAHDGVTWDGRDQRGRPVASGVYLCQLHGAGRLRATTKLMLLR
jgi:hypothetical protein